MHYVPSAGLNYRCLSHTDWPFYLALNQDRHVMHFISDSRTEEEIRTHSFEKRLQPWQKAVNTGCVSLSVKRIHIYPLE